MVWDYVTRKMLAVVELDACLLCMALREAAREVLLGAEDGRILRVPLQDGVDTAESDIVGRRRLGV